MKDSKGDRNTHMGIMLPWDYTIRKIIQKWRKALDYNLCPCYEAANFTKESSIILIPISYSQLWQNSSQPVGINMAEEACTKNKVYSFLLPPQSCKHRRIFESALWHSFHSMFHVLNSWAFFVRLCKTGNVHIMQHWGASV